MSATQPRADTSSTSVGTAGLSLQQIENPPLILEDFLLVLNVGLLLTAILQLVAYALVLWLDRERSKDEDCV